MTELTIHQFSYGTDNYGVLIHDAQTAQTACIDAGDADAALTALNEKGWQLTHLLITHHHGDHTAGLLAIKQATGCCVWGPKPLSAAIKGIDEEVQQDSEIEFAGRQIQVLQTPGHTLDMVNYYWPADQLVFTGDTLFSMGCGRLFEGDAAMMAESVNKLKALPPETQVYCAHEYTATNARFAKDVDPQNTALQQRIEEVTQLREQHLPTIPVTLATELQTNPFLRTEDAGIRATLNMQNDSETAVFAELRKRRNQY